MDHTERTKLRRSPLRSLVAPLIMSAVAFLPLYSNAQNAAKVSKAHPKKNVAAYQSPDSAVPMRATRNASTNSPYALAASNQSSYSVTNDSAIYAVGAFACIDGVSPQAGADYVPLSDEGNLFLDGRVGSEDSYVGLTLRQDARGSEGFGGKVRFRQHYDSSIFGAGLEFFPNEKSQLSLNGYVGTVCNDESLTGFNFEGLYDIARGEKSTLSAIAGVYSFTAGEKTSSGIDLGARLETRLSDNVGLFVQGKFFSSPLFEDGANYNVDAGLQFSFGKGKPSKFREVQWIQPCFDCKEVPTVVEPTVPEPVANDPTPSHPNTPNTPETPTNTGTDVPGNPVGNDGNTGTDVPGNPVGNDGGDGAAPGATPGTGVGG